MHRIQKSCNSTPSQRAAGTSLLWKGLCKYPHRTCNLPSLENYDFCLKHILEDKSAPYRPCLYLYTPSGKKCGKAALYNEPKENLFCAEHRRKANAQKLRGSMQHAPPETQETLLASLAHYVPKEKPVAVKKESSTEEESDSTNRPSQAVNPFVDVDASQIISRSTEVLDCLSEADSDAEPATLDSVWRDQNQESSDAESLDSQGEDPLKYAGVYTAEEVAVIMKEKMTRLQSLYIDQFRRLQHLLKERRRRFLHSLKKEKESLCSIHDQKKTTAKEQKLYQKLKALNRYHKYYGEEAILYKKAMERRAQVTESITMRGGSHKGKCAFTEGGVKCGAKTLPTTKYCRKHILEDTHQVLFRACGVKKGDHTCLEPTANVFENATCVYHQVLPPQPHITFVPTEPTTKDMKMELEISKASQEEAAIVSTLLSLSGTELKPEDFLKPVESEVLGTNGIEFPVPAKAIAEPSCPPQQLEVQNTMSTSAVVEDTPSNVIKEQIQEKNETTAAVAEHGYCAGLLPKSESAETGSLKVEHFPPLTPGEENASSGTDTAATDTEVGENVEVEMLDSNSAVQEPVNLQEKMDIDEEVRPNSDSNTALEQDSCGEELQVVQMSEVGVVEEVFEETKTEEPAENVPVSAESEANDG